MYQNRFVCFVDILGFGALVEQSADNENLQQSISKALASISENQMVASDYIRVNTEVVPPHELEEVQEIARLFVSAVRKEGPVTVSFFSDSIVLSALEDDLLASQTILHLLCTLSVRLWIEHNLTVRGGMTVGKLCHIEGGQLFGPAMNEAYKLESKHANYPRVVLSEACLNSFRSQVTFHPMETLIHKGDDYAHISLGTCYRHLLTSSMWSIGGDNYYEQCWAQMEELPAKLDKIAESQNCKRVADKYMWLAEDSRLQQKITPKRQYS